MGDLSKSATQLVVRCAVVAVVALAVFYVLWCLMLLIEGWGAG
jgi:hypothetical protein